MNVLYSQFFKNYVLRKKPDLVQPIFHSLSDLVLPRESLIHYLPRSQQDYGPSNEEPLIGTYPKKVNVFFDNTYVPLIGKAREIPFQVNEAIKAYRKGHYKYIWARNFQTFLNRKEELLVNNLALGQQQYRYVVSRFLPFERAYNQFGSLIAAINRVSVESDRAQFVHMEMPPAMPAYSQLKMAGEHYQKAFKDGQYVGVDNQAILPLRGYGAFWLMDWYQFLIGNTEISQFGKLTEKARENTHFIFSRNGKVWVVKLSLLKGWLDELNDKDGKPKSTRINVAKRILLVMKTLVDSGDETALQENQNETVAEGSSKAGATPGLGSEEEGAQETERAEDEEEQRTLSGGAVAQKDSGHSGSLLDLYLGDQTPDSGSDDTEAGASGGGNTEDHPEEWTADVDDSLLETAEEQSLEVGVKEIFVTPESGIERALNERAATGNLTVAEQAFFRKRGESYKDITMPNGEKLDKFIQIPEQQLRNIDAKIAPEIGTVLDKSMLESRSTKLKNGYAGQFLEKDIAGMILNIQNAGIALTDLKIQPVVNVQSAYNIYTMELHPVSGSPSKRTFRMPVIGSDGTYVIDGKKYHLQLQRMETPIRKINSHQVALTSYFDRHLMVSRSQKAVDDYGRWLKKQITAKTVTKSADDVAPIKVVLGRTFIRDLKAPRTFTILSQQYRSITTNDYQFNFDLIRLLGGEDNVRAVVNEDYVPVGKIGNDLLSMDGLGNVYRGDRLLGTIEALLGIETFKAPVEICTMNISGYHFPLGVVLSYYFGIDALLKVLQADYRVVPAGERLKLTEDEYAITFSDESLIFNRRDRLTGLIMGGLQKLPNLSNFARYDLNSKGVWVPIMGDRRVKPGHFEEMRLIFDLFVDPVTKGELVKRGYPTDMHYLLLEAAKMLTTDYTKHEIEITEQRFVGYERFAGKVYAELVKSTRQFRNKGSDRRHTMDMNPEAVIMNIISDTAVNQVEEVNPIHEIKEQEVVTFGGTGGRSEATMVRRTRGQQENYKGIISEAGKDSGKVGYVSYLTSNPKICDYRGNVDVSMPDNDTGLLSVTGNLMYGSTIDD